MEIRAEVTDDDKSVVLKGFDHDLTLNCADDVDFTDFVSRLTQAIESNTEINLQLPEERENEKINLVMETVRQFIDIYNSVIKEDQSQDNSV